jgi:hypothetical protein
MEIELSSKLMRMILECCRYPSIALLPMPVRALGFVLAASDEQTRGAGVAFRIARCFVLSHDDEWSVWDLLVLPAVVLSGVDQRD